MRYPCGTSNADFIKNWYNAQPFGSKTSYGYHEGEDYNLKSGGNSDLGQPLVAVADGKIVYYHNASHPTTGFGKHMVLECETSKGKRWYHYCHCQEITSKITDVKEGEVIGKLGKSGTTFAHLHFTVFKVDPAKLYKGIDSIALNTTNLNTWWERFELIKGETSMPGTDPLKECLSQHAKLVTEATKKETEIKGLKASLEETSDQITTLGKQVSAYKGEVTKKENEIIELNKKLTEKPSGFFVGKRKMLVGILTPITVAIVKIISTKLGVELDAQEMLYLILAGLAYIGIEGAKDLTVAVKSIENSDTSSK